MCSNIKGDNVKIPLMPNFFKPPSVDKQRAMQFFKTEPITTLSTDYLASSEETLSSYFNTHLFNSFDTHPDFFSNETVFIGAHLHNEWMKIAPYFNTKNSRRDVKDFWRSQQDAASSTTQRITRKMTATGRYSITQIKKAQKYTDKYVGKDMKKSGSKRAIDFVIDMALAKVVSDRNTRQVISAYINGCAELYVDAHWDTGIINSVKNNYQVARAYGEHHMRQLSSKLGEHYKTFRSLQKELTKMGRLLGQFCHKAKGLSAAAYRHASVAMRGIGQSLSACIASVVGLVSALKTGAPMMFQTYIVPMLQKAFLSPRAMIARGAAALGAKVILLFGAIMYSAAILPQILNKDFRVNGKIDWMLPFRFRWHQASNGTWSLLPVKASSLENYAPVEVDPKIAARDRRLRMELVKNNLHQRCFKKQIPDVLLHKYDFKVACPFFKDTNSEENTLPEGQLEKNIPTNVQLTMTSLYEKQNADRLCYMKSLLPASSLVSRYGESTNLERAQAIYRAEYVGKTQKDRHLSKRKKSKKTIVLRRKKRYCIQNEFRIPKRVLSSTSMQMKSASAKSSSSYYTGTGAVGGTKAISVAGIE